MIGSAFVMRYALSRFKDRLPGWTIAVRVYVDALWVFLTCQFLGQPGGHRSWSTPSGWIGRAPDRGVVQQHSCRAVLPLSAARNAWDAAMWALRTVFGGAAIPLLWLAVAGIVYGVSHGRLAERGPAGRRRPRAALFERARRSQEAIHSRWMARPRTVGEKIRDWVARRLGNSTHRGLGAADPARRGVGVVALRPGISRAGVAGHGGHLLSRRGGHPATCSG